MSQQAAGQLLAKAGPVAVAVVGAPIWAVGIGTILVATGAAAALALTGYGVYRYLSSSEGSAPLAALGGKEGTLWEYLGANDEVLGPLPFQQLLAMAASGELAPATKIRQVGASEWGRPAGPPDVRSTCEQRPRCGSGDGNASGTPVLVLLSGCPWKSAGGMIAGADRSLEDRL